MAADPSEENVLLRKISAGDQNAFKVLFDHYYKSIYQYSLHLLKSDVLAEEVVQETFLKIWRLGDELNKISQLEGYLITLARNRSLDHLRKTKLQIRVDKDLKHDWLETHNDTEEQIILNDTRKILQEAIERLPPQQRLVYQLCHQEGLKYDEAAKRLDLSTHTVQSYMKLALSSIRKYVSKNTDIGIILILFKLF